jgi:hypothetical protein
MARGDLALMVNAGFPAARGYGFERMDGFLRREQSGGKNPERNFMDRSPESFCSNFSAN